MYLTLWTLRGSPLYVYRHFTLCLSAARSDDLLYSTCTGLYAYRDSMTLCLSSIIIHVLLSMASYRRTRFRGNPKSSNFTSRSYTRPRQSPQRIAREPGGNPKSSNFTSRSDTRPRQSPQRVAQEQSSNFTSRSRARPRQSTQRVAREPCGNPESCNLAFARSTTRIHAKGCASRLRVATLPRVRALDHANPRKGLHSRSMASVLAPALERKIDTEM